MSGSLQHHWWVLKSVRAGGGDEESCDQSIAATQPIKKANQKGVVWFTL